MPPSPEVLRLLTLEERGFVAGAAFLGAGESLPACLEGLSRVRCQSALEALATLDRAARAAALAELSSDAGLPPPVPPGLDRLHADWIELALAGEPSDLVLALAGVTPPAVRDAAQRVVAARGEPTELRPCALDPELLDALVRDLLAPLVPLTAEPPASGPVSAAALAASPAALLAELADQGARALGRSLAGAPVEVRTKAAALAGPSFSAIVIAAATEGVPADARDRARALVAEAAPSSGAEALDPEARLQAIGVRALRDELAGERAAEDERRILAARLPAALGRLLLPG